MSNIFVRKRCLLNSICYNHGGVVLDNKTKKKNGCLTEFLKAMNYLDHNCLHLVAGDRKHNTSKKDRIESQTMRCPI